MNSDMDGKRERLAALLANERRSAGGGERAATAAPVEPPAARARAPSDPHAPFPLTRIQQSYLIGRSDEFVLGNISTHNYFEIELDRLDVDRFSAAWNSLIARHEMLRAVFSDDGLQRILPEVPEYEVAFHDFGGADPDTGARSMTALRERMSHQTLPYDRWPLFEVVVARHPDGRYRLQFSIDMLMADAMSTMILIRDLDALYAAPGTPLPPLTYSFRSYVESVGAVEGSDAYAQARAYWEARVADLPSAPELPLATTPESITHPRFVRREHMIDAERWERCQKRVQAAGLTSSALLLALFSIVLARWSKSGHFCLNLTLLNRPPLHPQMGDLVGDFTSLIMLETQVDPGATLMENVRRVQTQLWRDMNHRGFDGVDVLRLLNRRYASQQAVAMPIVFTSALGLSGSRSGEASGEFLSTLIRLGEDSSYGIAQSSQVWLDHVVRESAGALGLSWDSLEALFPEGLLDDMFAAYCGLLDRFADDRLAFEEPVELPLPPAQATRRAEANATAAPVPEGLLHGPFLARAAEDGDRIAVRHAATTLTYRELRSLALCIARSLDALDGGRSTLVGVVMVKGWEQIAAVLGILCYGAGYLPIDANLPEERVRLLLEQAGVDTVLVQADLAPELRLPEGTRILPVARDVAADDVDLPAARRTPDDIAYVIFTSGSTGIPKGVVIEHRGALNTVVDINRRFRVDRDDRVLCVSALSFDLSVYDIFGVLAAGGTLVIPEADRDKDPAHWLELVETEGVTVWNTVPPLLQLLVEQAEYRDGRGRGLASLRLALSSGDWLPPELPDRLTALRPGVELISLGGATEASIWSIYYPVLTSMAGRRSVPYGRPLDNQTFHVFDDALQDRPDWASGQLYIGGIGLAREYWGDAAKTAASFMRHPKTGERLYRTGDLGRYLPDGDIEFLGRNDSQVKIRGNRVELGEIEAALRRAEGIRDAVVIAQGDKFGKRRLVAYVVPDFGTETPDGTTDGGIEVLADAVERAAFKFERVGLRRFDEAAQAMPLGDALDASGRVAMAFPSGLAADDACAAPLPLPLSRLGAWLAHAADIEADGHALPKRLYPSAGSTYAVQCYLRVGEGRVEGLPAGRYWFDPAHHRLVRMETAAPASGLERAGLDLFLVADRRAIAPLYGRYAEKFAALEAGHLCRLLVGAAPAQGISLADGVCDAGLAAEFALSTAHLPLIALRVGGRVPVADPGTTATTARQSYRQFDGGALSIDALQSLLADLPPTPCSIVVAVHGEAAAADDAPADARLFRFDAATLSLVPAGRIDGAQLRRNQGIENQALHDAAQFTLYLFGDDAAPAWLAAGQWAQQAMHLGPGRGFGFCPVGNVATTALLHEPQDAEAHLVYALVGGRIAHGQAERWSVEPSAKTSDGHQELRRFLAQSLPDYMIPSVFATVPRIPLSANGKLDRAALPAIGDDALAHPRAYVAPEGPVEEWVAALWTQVLGRDGVGVHDNFFEIGGDSLSAIRLVSALRREFEAQSGDMTLRFVFEHPTIQAMAGRLASGDQAGKLERAAAELALAGGDVEEGEL